MELSQNTVSHYTSGACSQVITLLWVFFFYGTMTNPADGRSGTHQITDALKNGDGFNGKMVVVLLVHIIIMILDRIAHRYRWLSLKIWLHIGLCTCCFCFGGDLVFKCEDVWSNIIFFFFFSIVKADLKFFYFYFYNLFE